MRLVGVNGSALSVKGFRKFHVFLGDREVPSEMKLIVTSDLAVHEAILGLDFVEVHKCLIDYDRKNVTWYLSLETQPVKIKRSSCFHSGQNISHSAAASRLGRTSVISITSTQVMRSQFLMHSTGPQG